MFVDTADLPKLGQKVDRFHRDVTLSTVSLALARVGCDDAKSAVNCFVCVDMVESKLACSPWSLLLYHSIGDDPV